MAKKYIDADLLKKEIERLKETYLGHANFCSSTDITDGLQLASDTIDSLQQEQSSKRIYKDCNGCEYNRLLKDQIGWQFRGCFGGDYKGKPIAEIELCPLKVAKQEQSCDTCTNDKGCVTCKDGELWEGKEQPSEDLDLEKEIEKFLASEDSTSYDNAGTYKISYKDPTKIARHFYELGKAKKEE